MEEKMNDPNPYQTPSANVVKNAPAGAAGGSLQGGISGQYDFNIGDIISEAWNKTSGMKGPFWGAAIIITLIIFVVAIALTFALGAPRGEPNVLPQIIIQLVVTAVAYPLIAGIIMMGIRRSVDLPISFNLAFSYFGFAGTIIVAGILITILTMIGYLLLLLPGLYLALGYMLAIPLIVEKKLGAWQAMEASRRAITHHWFKAFFLMLLMGLIVAVSAIPLGLGLIWTYPMMVNVMGILYRDIFGVEEARAA
jgi:hypothetical protein